MPRKNDSSSTVSVVHPICCGLDVHKDTISACLIWSDTKGREQFKVAEFQTFTDDLIKLKNWLLEHRCPVVAMESTGHYWTPIHNILEHFFTILLVNPRHMKNVPGRETDISDSRWIAGLLRHGLLKGGFIPPECQRQWRDLTRTRKSYVKSAGDFKRGIHKLLQSANLKIDSVISDLFGATGRNLLKLLVTAASAPSRAEVEACLDKSVKDRAGEFYRSMEGFFSNHHRILLGLLLETVERLEHQIELLDERIREVMAEHEPVIERLDAIPGINAISAHAILSEIGTSLEAFSNPAALAAWAGLCPGNNQSAGKRYSGRSRVRKNHLKEIMIEVAWPAIKKRHPYYRAKYYALKSRLGWKKAIVAVAHRILTAIYHVVKHGVSFKGLGEAYLLNLNRKSKLKYLRKQASLLGFELTPPTSINNSATAPIFTQS